MAIGCATAPKVTPADANASPPVKSSGPGPVYPQELAQEGIEGWVIVETTVSREGRVTRPRALRSSDPRFEASAIEAVRQWQFQPAIFKGRPVEVTYTLTVNFELPPEETPNR
ncbi:MAG: energy transducer TonB [Thermoanaerobaculia bacterium]